MEQHLGGIGGEPPDGGEQGADRRLGHGGDRLAECRCKATVGYARRTLHCLAREAERSLMLVGDPLTI